MRSALAFWLVLVAALTVASLAPVASAHAWLLGAHPGPNQQVPNPPDVLFIRFTENVEHDYTRAEVYDLNGTRIDVGEVVFDDAKRDQILVPLGPTTDGVYTVRWYSLSVDTHTAQGSYVFAVGSASLSGAPPASSTHYHGEGTLPVWVESMGRAFHYAAAAAAIGMPLFVLLVAKNAASPNLLRMLRSLVGIAAFGVLGASIVLLAFSQRVHRTLGELASSPFGSVGSLLTVRTGLQILLLVLAIGALITKERPRIFRFALSAVVAAGAMLLLATSQSSHAAALSHGRTTAVGADLLHLVAGSVWVGGVIAFLFLFPHEPRETLANWVHRFSPIALTCVMVILLTGIYASLLHIKSFEELVAGTYGRMILLKICLLVPLIALGAFNRYVSRRRLVDGQQWRSSNLRRALAAETLLMATILVAAGVLATSAPPSTGLDVPDAPTTVKFEKSLSKAHLVFTIGPAPITVGLHNYTVELHAFDGSNPAGSDAFLEFTPPGGTKLDELHRMTRVSADRWTLDGGFLTERGEWQVHVSVQADEYAVNTFKVKVQ